MKPNIPKGTKENYEKSCKKKTEVDNKCDTCKYRCLDSIKFKMFDNQMYTIRYNDCYRLKHICPFCNSFIPIESFFELKKRENDGEVDYSKKEKIKCNLCLSETKHVDLIHFDIFNIPEEIEQLKEPMFSFHKSEELPEHTIKKYKLPKKGLILSITKLTGDPIYNTKFRVIDDMEIVNKLLEKINTKEHIVNEVLKEHRGKIMHINTEELK